MFCPPLSITFYQIQRYHVILVVMSDANEIIYMEREMYISQKRTCSPPNNYSHGQVRGQGLLSLQLENVNKNTYNMNN